MYHVGGEAELGNVELTQMLLDRCGADWQLVSMVADRKGHDRRYSLDDTRLRGIGYSPRPRHSARVSLPPCGGTGTTGHGGSR